MVVYGNDPNPTRNLFLLIPSSISVSFSSVAWLLSPADSDGSDSFHGGHFW